MRFHIRLFRIMLFSALGISGAIISLSETHLFYVYGQDPTAQQQTVDAAVNKLFTETAQVNQTPNMTQTVEAVFHQAQTATAQSRLTTPTAVVAPTSPSSPADVLDPRDALNAYLTSVNSRDFKSAYELFLYPKAKYRSFADGWGDTVNVEGAFGDFQPYRGSRTRGDIPGLLIATLINGETDTYYGCYFMIFVEHRWYAEDFKFQLLFKRRPISSDIETFTSKDCSSQRAAMGLIYAPTTENVEAIARLKELNLPVFRVGYTAVVVADNVSVRDRSTSAGNKITTLTRGSRVIIIGGPELSTQYVWWKVKLDNDLTGWVAALSNDGTQILDLP